MAEIDVNALMRRYQKGDQSAFNEIYNAYSTRVYGYLSKSLANQDVDEVFQKCFLKIHSQRKNFDSSKLKFDAWLFTICKSCLIDHARVVSRQRRNTDEIAIAQSMKQQVTPSNQEIDLSPLPSKQQDAIRLRYYEDLDFDEIAKILNTSSSNTRQLVSRGLKKLKELLGSS